MCIETVHHLVAVALEQVCIGVQGDGHTPMTELLLNDLISAPAAVIFPHLKSSKEPRENHFRSVTVACRVHTTPDSRSITFVR